MIVTAEILGIEGTDEEAQRLANTMPVTPRYFAAVSCEGDRLFGYVSHCQEQCVTNMNACARRSLWRELFAITQETQKALNLVLSEQYMVSEVVVRAGEHVRLPYAGVTDVNVEQSIDDIEGYDAVDYSPILESGIELVPNGGDYLIYLDQSIVVNPDRIMVRQEIDDDCSNGWSSIKSDWPSTKPYRDGDYWVIPVAGKYVAPDDTVSVIDCKLSYFDAPDQSELECDGDIAPVYPGTVQRVPIYRTETLESGEIRYWVQTRDMIAPDFVEDIVDIGSGEFYKFIQTVEFKCFSDTQRYATVTLRRRENYEDLGVVYGIPYEVCEDTEPCDAITQVLACANLVSTQDGVVSLQLVDVDEEGEVSFHDAEKYEGVPLVVNVYYKVAPDQRTAVETLREAIAARAAAEVALTGCGCSPETGYFAEMREELDTVTTSPMGVTSVHLRYGNRRGAQKYAKALQTMPRKERAEIL